MEAKELDRILRSAELRNPKVYNASRERYVAEISYKAGIRQVVEWLEEYAIHGGNIPLSSVLDDMKIHSLYGGK